METEYRIERYLSPFTGKLARVRIIPRPAEPVLPTIDPKVEEFAAWDRLKASDGFWQKYIGWKLFQCGDGTYSYQCLPGTADHLALVLRVLKSDQASRELRNLSYDQRAQFLMLERMMQIGPEQEKSFVCHLSHAIELAIRNSILVMLSPSGNFEWQPSNQR